MPIIKYTTTIAANKTVGEIQTKLAKAGVQEILLEYSPGAEISALSFRIKTNGNVIIFRLPANIDGVLTILKKSRIDRHFKTPEQASRVAWRILKTWVETQLALTEIGMADIIEVFLPYAQNNNGETVYQIFKKTEFKRLSRQALDNIEKKT